MQKKTAGSRYIFYSDEQQEIIVERLKIEKGLRKAIEKDEFELYYQPKVYIRAGKIVDLVALIRWHHPQEINIQDNRVELAIIDAINSHTLGYSVIAEGVDTKDQLELLKEKNCNEIQGSLLVDLYLNQL
ncbi:EAL domain-containing protein [Alkalihalobacillus deserti]|uniref:EAL domain-containing protein n=1 Tax=Alkalihalobacillus deserti TaxID=2879466 RepID=UPI001D134F33|nr:EAL domain-containing protein [Alkalihalobacillus deserti]